MFWPIYLKITLYNTQIIKEDVTHIVTVTIYKVYLIVTATTFRKYLIVTVTISKTYLIVTVTMFKEPLIVKFSKTLWNFHHFALQQTLQKIHLKLHEEAVDVGKTIQCPECEY